MGVCVCVCVCVCEKKEAMKRVRVEGIVHRPNKQAALSLYIVFKRNPFAKQLFIDNETPPQ